MQTKEYRFEKNPKWGDGAWNDEPDKVQWLDAATGLPCLVKRNDLGVLCGYVGVAKGHSLYGVDYTNEKLNDLDVHGGLTYSDSSQNQDPIHGICHIPDAGEPDHVWWFGFDCGHFQDLSPTLEYQIKQVGLGRQQDVIYRQLEYVKDECQQLAKQLATFRGK